jgi:hypothetical protein
MFFFKGLEEPAQLFQIMPSNLKGRTFDEKKKEEEKPSSSGIHFPSLFFRYQ